jgi:hypothetical protein
MSYAKVRKEIAQQSGDVDRLPCMFCKTPTLRETLTQYGARCFTCYEAYCREPRTFPYVGDKQRHGPRDWAHALQARHKAGEKLTPAQVDAYQAALRHEPEPQP